MTIMTRKTFSGQGRKPRQGVKRHACGKIVRQDQGESAEQVTRTAYEARIRVLGATQQNASDKAWGSAIGRLFLAGAITGALLPVATRYARLKSIMAVLDDVRPSHGVPVLARLSCGFGSDPYERFDPELAWDVEDANRRRDLIERIRSDDAGATSALWELQSHPSTAGAGYVLTRVVLWDEIEPAQDNRGQALLRDALNRLEKLWATERRA